MVIHHLLSDLRYVPFWKGDVISQEFKPKITRDNADNLHGISYYDIFLKPRSYNRTVMQFIEAVLRPTDKFDYKTACEVNTRIYVRGENKKWKAIPKRKFWKDQCHWLWNLWKNFVNFSRPRPDYDNALESARLAWSDRLMHQIDSRRKDGEFRYNPLLSVRSRQKLRDIYQRFVFNRELYDLEKGKPGRKSKAFKERQAQSGEDRTGTGTIVRTASSRMQRV